MRKSDAVTSALDERPDSQAADSQAIGSEAPSTIGKPPRFRRAGSFVFVSGTGVQPREGTGIKVQTRACIQEISDILEEIGGGLENLVEVTSYLARMTDFVDYNEAYSKFFSVDGPARTTIAVDQLAHPNALIEMRGVAYIAENTSAES